MKLWTRSLLRYEPVTSRDLLPCSTRTLLFADAAGVAPGAPTEIRGARIWAKGAVAFSRFARFVEPALVNGAAGLVFAPGGRLSRALSFKIAGGKVVEVEIIADPERLRHLDLILDAGGKDSRL